MSIQISYMGTKRRLAPKVASLVNDLPSGPILDVFSGMGAVSESLAVTQRNVWVNDIQPFAALVSRVLFCTHHSALAKCDPDVFHESFSRNVLKLLRRFGSLVEMEQACTEDSTERQIERVSSKVPFVGSDPLLEKERRTLAHSPKTFPYRMATITWAGTYFGVRQCIEIDSIRYAIDWSRRYNLITPSQYQMALVALGQAVCKANNSTGQFAQFIKPNPMNIRRVLKQRSKSIWTLFCQSLESIRPIGTDEWRCDNRAFRQDSTTLLRKLSGRKTKPAVVYADPPYSEAQYSRYYHLLDALIEYRYPEVCGAGRYPRERFQTPYSLQSRVICEMERLIKAARKLEAVFVLSYPSNGLLLRMGHDPIALIRGSYRSVRVAVEENQFHSTFGSNRTTPKIETTELILVGEL